MREWFKKHYVAVLILTSLIVAPILSHRDTLKATNNAKAVAKQAQVDQCRRSNVTRAYFQLRAAEVRSDTAGVAPYVFAVLNCEKTVENGQPRPLTRLAQDNYLRLFQKGYVADTRNDSIVGKVSFEGYFSSDAGQHP